jgi:hypothetical protein
MAYELVPSGHLRFEKQMEKVASEFEETYIHQEFSRIFEKVV